MILVDNIWQEWFYRRLRNQAHPLVIFPDRIVPAAALWAGARFWVRAFRAAGLVPGDRILLAVPPGPGFLYVLIAALCEKLTLAPVAALEADAGEMVRQVDPRLVLLAAGDLRAPEPGVWHLDADGLTAAPRPLRAARHAPTPELRLLLRTSGTVGRPRWTALSDGNLSAVLHSHRPELDLRDARVLSVLPWTHAFGLVIDLLPALLDAACVVRDPGQGRSAESIASALREYECTHLSAVPLVFRRLLDLPECEQIVQNLKGGVVGGAPVSARLAERLACTRLRAGYGQTEAGPGLTLGAPGRWCAGDLGAAVGCELRVNDVDELEFRCPNLALGYWNETGLDAFARDEWRPTGDLVRATADGYVFLGRRDDAFKLANGRFVYAALWETRLCERLPAVSEALLGTTDGETLNLYYSSVDDIDIPPDSLVAALGLQPRLVARRGSAEFMRDAKGGIDRRRSLEREREICEYQRR